MTKALYAITIQRQGAKTLRKMPRPQAERILSALDKLAENPDRPDIDVSPLVGRPGFRLRIGTLRIIFKRDDNARLIDVIQVASRGQIYKRR